MTLTYEADIVQRDGLTIASGHLLYDNGKFRLLRRWPQATGKKPLITVQLYDGTSPPIAWGYELDGKSAWPSFPTCLLALSAAAHVNGEAATRRLYHIPLDFKFSPMSQPVPPRPTPEIAVLRRDQLDEATLHPVGTARMDGYVCQVYQSGPITGRFESSVDRGAVASGTVVNGERAWIEPRSGLVLRLETHTSYGAASPVPPSRRIIQVSHLRFLPSAPAAAFQLPPGATANVPRLFDSVRLPPGVRRVPATGRFADTGIGFH